MCRITGPKRTRLFFFLAKHWFNQVLNCTLAEVIPFAWLPPGHLESLKQLRIGRNGNTRAPANGPLLQQHFPLFSNPLSFRAACVVFQTSLLPHHMQYSQQVNLLLWRYPGICQACRGEQGSPLALAWHQGIINQQDFQRFFHSFQAEC